MLLNRGYIIICIIMVIIGASFLAASTFILLPHYTYYFITVHIRRVKNSTCQYTKFILKNRSNNIALQRSFIMYRNMVK